MIKNYIARFFFAVLLATGGITLSGYNRVIFAQSSLTDCQLPQPNEYILLVLTQTSETQQQVRNAFPETAQLNVCQYGENVVTRIGGFSKFEFANSWGQYIKDNLELLTIVQPSNFAQNPPTGSANAVFNSPPRTPVAQTPGNPEYNLQALGTGYAVLVDYFSNPELAYQLQNLLGRKIGLVSYFARPYLLIEYTSRQVEANATASSLSQRGFSAAVVDSRQVTVLTTEIK